MKDQIEKAAIAYANEESDRNPSIDFYLPCKHGFKAGAEFMQSETVKIMDAMTQTSQCNSKLLTENQIMREALKTISYETRFIEGVECSTDTALEAYEVLKKVGAV